MAKIIKLKDNAIIGGTSNEDVYPITHSKAVYDTKNRILQDLIDIYDKNTIDTESLTESYNKLKSEFDALLGTGNTTEIIDTFEDIKGFLSGFQNSDNLASILDTIKESLDSVDNSIIEDVNNLKSTQLIAGNNITIDDDYIISAVDTTYGVATHTKNGLMSANDKYKLDNILKGEGGTGGVGGSSETTEEIKVTTNVGYYANGDKIEVGTPLEMIFKRMLYRPTPADLKSKISTPNNVEYGSTKGFITYTAVKNDNGDIVEAYMDGDQTKILEFGEELNGERIAVRQLSGNYTAKETYRATVKFAESGDMEPKAITDQISVNVYRKWFAGKCSNPILASSNDVRALPSSGLLTTNNFTFTATNGWENFAIAVEANKQLSVVEAKGVTGNYATDSGMKGPYIIQVEGANGSQAVDYNVYIFSVDSPSNEKTFNVKLI